MLIPDARVLRVLREGAHISIVVQMPQSNTVLQCTVDFERSQANVRAHHLQEGRMVTLQVLSCKPPGVVVGVSIVLDEVEEEAVGLGNFRRWQHAFSQPTGAVEAAACSRKRPCFFAEDDEGGGQDKQ